MAGIARRRGRNRESRESARIGVLNRGAAEGDEITEGKRPEGEDGCGFLCSGEQACSPVCVRVRCLNHGLRGWGEGSCEAGEFVRTGVLNR